MVEFLERLGVEFECELWLVRADGITRTAHVYLSEDIDWLRDMEHQTRPWLGFAHPRIAEIHSTSWSRNHLVIVVGDERGTTFPLAAKRLDDPREREAWAAAELIAVAEGLDAMARYRPGAVHRRVHDEMIVGGDGHARLTAPIAYVQSGRERNYVGAGRSIGTPYGLSPELAQGLRVTPASDVFQLGVLLYTAIALRRPFQGDSDFATLKAIIDAETPRPPSDTLAVWSVIKRSLARDPAGRYPTPAAFADALRTAADATPPASALAKLSAFEPGQRVAPNRSAAIVGSRCTKRWEALEPTSSDGIRYCGGCKHEVVEVRSLAAVIPLLGKRCVAYRPQ
jgi:serine/threonine protein kinase